MPDHEQEIIFTVDLSQVRKGMEEIKAEAAKGIVIPIRTEGGAGAGRGISPSPERMAEIKGAEAAANEVNMLRSSAFNSPVALAGGSRFTPPPSSPFTAGAFAASLPVGSASPNWSYLLSQQSNSIIGGLTPTSQQNPWFFQQQQQPGQPPAPNAPAGSRSGFSRLLTTAVAFHAGARLLDSSRQYSIDSALAGNNQLDQLNAEKKLQEGVGSVPFFGRVAQFLSDPYGTSELATESTLRSATNAENRITLNRTNAGFYRGLSAQASEYRYGSDSFAAKRIQIQEEDRKRREEIQLRQTTTAEADTKDVQALRLQLQQSQATRVESLARRIRGDTPPNLADPGSVASDGSQEDARAQIAREDEAAIGRLRTERARTLKDRTDRAYADAEKITGADTADIDRRQRGYGLETGSQALGQRGFNYAAALQKINAEFTPVFNEKGDLVALAGIQKTTNAAEFGQKLDRFNLAKDAAKTESDRQQILDRGENAALSARANRDPLGAEIATIRARTQASNVGLSVFSPQFLTNTIRGGLEEFVARQASGDQVTDQRTARTAEITSLGSRLARKPLQAEIDTLEGQRTQELAVASRNVLTNNKPTLDQIGEKFNRLEALAQRDDVDRNTLTQVALSGDARQLRQLLRRDRSPQDNAIAAEADSIANQGNLQSLQFQQAGKSDFARQALENTALQLQVQKQSILDSFRGVADDPRLIRGSDRDTFDGSSLKEITDLLGQIKTAIDQIGVP